MSKSLTTNIIDNNNNDLFELNTNKLTKFEKEELVSQNIKKIYYYFKNKNVNLNNLEYNSENIKKCFDNNHRLIIEKHDHINYRYEIIEELGKGSYSNVIKCLDFKHFKNVAIKVNKNHNRYTNSFFTEVNILKLCKNNDYLVNYICDFRFRNHYCIVMDIYGCNLLKYEFKSQKLKNKLNIFTDILNGLDYLKKQNIIHGDLKPENILLKNNNKNAVITDFGLSIIYFKENVNYHTNLQTIWYRSPEIFFQIPFNESIDIWSFGIMFYELLFNEPFITTKIDEDYLINIVHILDLPYENYILSDYRILKYFAFVENRWELHKTFDSCNKILRPGKKHKLNINYLLYKSNIESYIISLLLKFIKKCLIYESRKRIIPREALEYLDYIKTQIN